MSVGIIQIGQCGNQIGCNIFNNLVKTMKSSSEYLSQQICDTYFTLSDSYSKDIPTLNANALLIDMESKVIDRELLLAKKNGWEYKTCNILRKQSGSGNNWANGFFHHGPSVENVFCEILSKFAENFDYLDTCVIINSLAGGTGSGLGSYLTALVKEIFPEINLMNFAVWPNDSGEVVVNSYNTLFSISENYKAVDMMTLINNQEIYDICKDIYGLKKISFENLNDVISQHIIEVLVPATKINKFNCNNNCINNNFSSNQNDQNSISSSPFQKPFNTLSFPSELIYHLCPNPKLRFTNIIATPEIPKENMKFTNNSWNSLVKRGLQRLKTGSNEAKINWNIFAESEQNVKNKAIITIFRGKKIDELEFKENIENKWGMKNNNKEINNPNDASFISKYCLENNINEISYKNDNTINDYEKHLTIIANSNLYCSNIRKCLNKAYEMYEYNAFVHQYQKYGLEKNDFLDAFAFCEQIIYDYDNL